MAAKNIATLAIKVIADAAGLQVGFTKAEKSVQQFSAQVKGLAGTLGGMLGIGSAAGIGAWAIKLASDLEQTTIAFEVMTGSASQAKAIVDEMRQFGAVTPFQSADLLEATKVLMQFGVATDQATGYVKTLSEVASGDAERLSRIALAFGQISATGRLMGQDLLQLVNANFNPLKEISRTTGESMTSLRKKMEAGQISFQMVADAFKSATSEGGRFYGMNERMSETLAGKWSTLKDEAAMLATTIANELVPALKQAVADLIPIAREVGSVVSRMSELNKLTSAQTAKSVFSQMLSPVGFLKSLFSGGEFGRRLVMEPSKLIKEIDDAVFKAGAGIYTDIQGQDPFGDIVDGLPQAEQAINSAAKTTSGFWDRVTGQAGMYGEMLKQAADRMNDLAKRAETIRESLRTPFEIARDGFSELNNLMTFGLIDPETFARGGIRLKEELMEALKAQRGIKDLSAAGGVGAVQAGTSGAFSAIQAAGREYRAQEARQQEQIKLQAEANALLAKIEAKEQITIAEASL